MDNFLIFWTGADFFVENWRSCHTFLPDYQQKGITKTLRPSPSKILQPINSPKKQRPHPPRQSQQPPLASVQNREKISPATNHCKQPLQTTIANNHCKQAMQLSIIHCQLSIVNYPSNCLEITNN
jgi:hypothetical protein